MFANLEFLATTSTEVYEVDSTETCFETANTGVSRPFK